MTGSLGSGVLCKLGVTEVILVLGDGSTESVDSEDEGTTRHRDLQSVFRTCNKFKDELRKLTLDIVRLLIQPCTDC